MSALSTKQCTVLRFFRGDLQSHGLLRMEMAEVTQGLVSSGFLQPADFRLTPKATDALAGLGGPS